MQPTSSNSSDTWRIACPAATNLPDMTGSSAAETPQNLFESLEAVFAGTSVLIGLIALIIGLLQLQRHRKASRLIIRNEICELEAGSPKASSQAYCCKSQTDVNIRHGCV